MKQAKFLKCEYLTVREEVKETKARIFKLAVLGIIGVPSASTIARDYKLDEIILSLPLLVCAFLIYYLSENLALMRCGRYIKQVIEPKMRDEQNRIGWEHWLEEEAKGEMEPRRVDKLVVYFFNFLFGIYYILTALLAVHIVKSKWGQTEFEMACIVYGVIFVVFAAILIQHIKFSVSTEPQKSKANGKAFKALGHEVATVQAK